MAVVIAMMPLIVLVALTTLVNNGACDSEKGKKKRISISSSRDLKEIP